MKKLFTLALSSFVLLLLFTGISYASVCEGYESSLVPCGQMTTCRCELSDVFVMIKRIFDFVVWTIATPLAGVMIVIGGVLILLSGFNNNWYGTGKQIITWSILSILLIFGSWLIVDIVLRTIGYTADWSSPF